jgi:hypothetical protein
MMDEDDPEKRIFELERQLAEPRAACEATDRENAATTKTKSTHSSTS